MKDGRRARATKALQALGISALGVTLAIACGGTSSDGGNGPGGTQGASKCPAPAAPASNVDVATCASIVDDMSSTIGSTCQTCCTQAGFTVSSFINAGKCTCANARPGETDAGRPCASQNANGDVCSACCVAKDYISSVWSNGISCDCYNKGDPAICACALSDPDPADSCDRCCVANGFISDMYIGIGTAECRCIDPG